MSNDNMKDPKLDALAAARLLDEIFEEAEVEHNTVPMEALSAYSGYRKERFALQKIILVVAIVLFMLLPLLFISPKYTVSEATEGERNLPVYQIDISGVLPVGYVTASIDGHSLPVYEVDSHTYTVEPTANGELDLEVSLFNDQKETQTVDVTGVDETVPVITGSELRDGMLVLEVSDDGCGIDYEAAYAEDGSGEVVRPAAISEEEGKISFKDPEKGWEIYISDKIGNTLHLKLSKKN